MFDRTESGNTQDIAECKKKWKRIGECKQCGRCCGGWIVAGKFGAMLCPDARIVKRGDSCITECKVYNNRPWFCREFPVEPADNAYIKSCGFSFRKRSKRK